MEQCFLPSRCLYLTQPLRYFQKVPRHVRGKELNNIGTVYPIHQKESVSDLKKGQPGERSSAGVRPLVAVVSAVTFPHHPCAVTQGFYPSTIPPISGHFCWESMKDEYMKEPIACFLSLKPYTCNEHYKTLSPHLKRKTKFVKVLLQDK